MQPCCISHLRVNGERLNHSLVSRQSKMLGPSFDEIVLCKYGSSSEDTDRLVDIDWSRSAGEGRFGGSACRKRVC